MTPRLRAIAALIPLRGVVVDVGCDHGHLAAEFTRRAPPGVIVYATEREPHRLPRRSDIRRVVADGLAPFRRVDVAVVAGMGPTRILEVLASGPRPAVAVLHAPQAPDRLRAGLAEHGWRIDAERLAPEGDRIAEVVRVVPGREPHAGPRLWFGPLLDEDPLRARQLALHLRHHRALLARIPSHAPRHGEVRERVRWLERELARCRAILGGR